MQCKAVQLQPEEDGHSEGARRVKIQPSPSSQTQSARGAGPSRASGSAREPVAGKGSKSYDSLSGQLGARCPGILSPSQPFKAKLRWALPASLQNGPTVGCVCARPRAGAERTDIPTHQVSIWSPVGGCPAPCQLPSGPDLPDHSVLPCANLPQTRIISRTPLGPRGHFHTCQVARFSSSNPALHPSLRPPRTQARLPQLLP